jgi:F-box protein 9
MNSAEAELESFRQQWREEVSAKTKGKQPARAASSSGTSSKPAKSNAPEVTFPLKEQDEELDEVEPYVHRDLGEKQHGRRLDEKSPPAIESSSEAKSALEHYEKAVERENQGSLGDSVNLYRKAFKVYSFIHSFIHPFIQFSSRIRK